MEEVTPTQLKTYEAGQRKLIGRSGKTYRIEESISGARFLEYEIFQRQLATGLSIDGLYQEIIDIYQLTNTTKTVKKKNGDIETITNTGEIARRLHNIAAGIQKVGQRKSTVFQICSLFINGEGEDIGVYNHAVSEAKIEDLITEYPHDLFFSLLGGLWQGLTRASDKLTLLGSEEATTEQQE